MKPYLCTTAGCKKSFEKEEDCKHHQAVHSSMRFKCNMCDKTFNRLDNKYAHIRSKHLNPTIRSSVGFFKFNCSEPISRKVGRTIYHCHVEECSYSSHDKQQLDNHIRSNTLPNQVPRSTDAVETGARKSLIESIDTIATSRTANIIFAASREWLRFYLLVSSYFYLDT